MPPIDFKVTLNLSDLKLQVSTFQKDAQNCKEAQNEPTNRLPQVGEKVFFKQQDYLEKNS